jgi:hypothetical protein
MPFNIGLLSDAALTGLSDTEKQAMQRQATQQFLLGSLLSGDPGIGFKSAMDIPATAISMQDMLRKSQQAQQQQQELAAFTGKFAPTEAQATRKALNATLGREADLSSPYALATKLGLPQQRVDPQLLNQPIDYQQALTESLRLAGNPAQPQLRETLKSMQPTILPSGVTVNANMQAIGGVPTFDPKTGLVATPNVRGGNVDFNVSAAPGYGKAVEQNLTYALQPGEQPLYDRAGNLIGVRDMAGSLQTLQQREAAKAIGGSFAIPEQVVNPITQQKEFRSRANILGFTNPASATGATGATGARGAVSELSPAQQAVNLATSKNYGKFTDIALDAALTVGDRKTSAEYLYNAAEQIDPNKLTEFFATGASYMRAIPGVGDKFDSLVGNVNLLNKTRSEGVLKGLSNIKGNANAFEGGIVDKATTGVTDPKFVTKYVSALEIAAADKDDARQRFIDSYTGDPKSIYTAWANSPDNPRLYNHPKVNQFLNEQIAANPSAPVLPAGFQLVQGKSGRYGVKKPDGTVMTIGQ